MGPHWAIHPDGGAILNDATKRLTEVTGVVRVLGDRDPWIAYAEVLQRPYWISTPAASEATQKLIAHIASVDTGEHAIQNLAAVFDFFKSPWAEHPDLLRFVEAGGAPMMEYFRYQTTRPGVDRNWLLGRPQWRTDPEAPAILERLINSGRLVSAEIKVPTETCAAAAIKAAIAGR